MNRLVWCAEINNGIALVDPNDNLASAYLKKAENALDAMHSVNPKEWKISTGYYSLYFSLYAVLMKVGIHSENHICKSENALIIFISDLCHNVTSLARSRS